MEKSSRGCMKTYVAEGVLCNWSCGMIVVKAENKDDAVRLVMETVRKESGEYTASTLYENCFEEECLKYKEQKDNEGCLKCKLRELGDNEVVYMEGGD